MKVEVEVEEVVVVVGVCRDLRWAATGGVDRQMELVWAVALRLELESPPNYLLAQRSLRLQTPQQGPAISSSLLSAHR